MQTWSSVLPKSKVRILLFETSCIILHFIFFFFLIFYFYNYITFISLHLKNRNFYTCTIKYLLTLHYILRILDSTPALYITLPHTTTLLSKLLNYFTYYLTLLYIHIVYYTTTHYHTTYS